ncbi:Flp family type IVb pilin [Bacillus sp. DJP31]|uniref:Flp family type IVb pilin n=1 Tax=Bacillus sp. DJP31 TaxID=3409789 RepID=UPI003BB75536
MKNKLVGLLKEEQGQGMTEYGLVLGIIAVAVVTTLGLLRTQIITMFDNVKAAITGATTGTTP